MFEVLIEQGIRSRRKGRAMPCIALFPGTYSLQLCLCNCTQTGNNIEVRVYTSNAGEVSAFFLLHFGFKRGEFNMLRAKAFTVSLAMVGLCLLHLSARAQTSMSEESTSGSSSSSSNSSSSSSSTEVRREPGVWNAEQRSNLVRPVDNGTFTVPNVKPSIMFVPKFKQRLNDLADQVHLAQGKAFITADEAAKFMERQSKLLTVEADLSRRGYPKEELDSLEKSITSLNADLFAAMHKTDPVKPTASEKEVNDPNLIPAYNDPELKPGSGHVDAPKK